MALNLAHAVDTTIGQRAPFVNGDRRLRRLKTAIWMYIILLIFEGALRKWVVPGLATPLLVVRDPVAVYIIFTAFRFRALPTSPVFYGSILLAILAMPAAIVFGHGNPVVALYGARPFLLHLPAMFVMASVLDRSDLIKIGKFLLIVSLGMTVLIALQFYSPQSAFINRSVGGEEGGGFSGAMGYLRPPGTFSFTSGVGQFYSLLAPFVLYFWLNPTYISAKLRISATIALLLALPLSISRGLVFQVVLTLVFASIVALSKPRLMMRGVVATLALVLTAIALSPFDFFQTAMQAFMSRFTTANETEGGMEGVLIDRYFGGLLQAFTNSGDSPWWGMGIGLGTNVGAQLMTGETQFLVAENEWQRMTGELGIILGFIAIAMRLVVAIQAALKSGKALLRNDCLPWLLLSVALTTFPQGNWAQPTSLGFSIFSMALLLSSLRKTK